jgi:hypothetical protein
MEVYDGTRWLNVNTPPIGSTYIQWASASAPQAIWPNTQWVSSDFDDGSFLRSRGGNANVGASGSLTGTTQTGALETHGHALSGGVTNAGALNTASASADHTHGWGGVWNIDNSNAVNNPTNGDGSGNTYSDAHGYWNRWIGGSTSTNGNHAHTAYAPVHDTNSSASQGYPNGDNHQSFRSSDRGRDRGITSAAMSAEGNHAHDVFYYNHRHWIAPRTTGGASSTSHAHSLPAHGHANDFAVGAPNSGAVASETRPQNKAAIFWRRIN